MHKVAEEMVHVEVIRVYCSQNKIYPPMRIKGPFWSGEQL